MYFKANLVLVAIGVGVANAVKIQSKQGEQGTSMYTITEVCFPS